MASPTLTSPSIAPSPQATKFIEIASLDVESYTPRISLQSSVEQALSEHSFVVIQGTESSGKSALAKLYINSNQHRFTHVLWIQSGSKPLLFHSCKKVAQAIGITPPAHLNALIEKIHHFVLRHPHTLLIFDHLPHKFLHKLPALSLLKEGPAKILVLSRHRIWKGTIIQLKALSEPQSFTIIEKQLGYKLDDEDHKTILHVVSHNLSASPLALHLFANYYSLLKTQDVDMKWSDYLKRLGFHSIDSTNIHAIEETLLKGMLAELADHGPNPQDVLNLLHTIAYFQSESIPLLLLQNVSIPSESEQRRFDAIRKLHVAGIIEAPWMDPRMTFDEYQEIQADTLSISISTKIQRILRKQHTGSEYLKSALRAVQAVFFMSRRDYAEAAEKRSPHFASVQALLSHIKNSQIEDPDVLFTQAVLTNSAGRYFQVQDNFESALTYYKKSSEILEKGQKWIAKNRKSLDVEVIMQWTRLFSEIPHNLGSTSLRLWEQLDDQEHEDAIDALYFSKYNYRQPQILEKRKIGKKGKNKAKTQQDYEDLHFSLFSLRGIARALKKQGRLLDARDLFEELASTLEYINWPKDSASETKPIALMDLGVIYRLIEDKRLKRFNFVHDGGKQKMRSRKPAQSGKQPPQLKQRTPLSKRGKEHSLLAAIDPAVPAKAPTYLDDLPLFASQLPTENYRKAHSYLLKSVDLYNADDYKAGNKEKDLATVLSRLGELYLSVAVNVRTVSKDERKQYLAQAVDCFKQAIAKIRQFNNDQPSVLEGRCLYRLARAYARGEELIHALLTLKEALEMQNGFYAPHHTYVTTSQELLEDLIRKFERKATPSKLTVPRTFSGKGTFKKLRQSQKGTPREKSPKSPIDQYEEAANQKHYLAVNTMWIFEFVKLIVNHPLVSAQIATSHGQSSEEAIEEKILQLRTMADNIKTIIGEIKKSPENADNEAMKLFRLSATGSAQNLEQVLTNIKDKLIENQPQEIVDAIKKTIKEIIKSIDPENPSDRVPVSALLDLRDYLYLDES